MGNCCLNGSSTMVWAAADEENDHWVYYSDPNLQHKQTLLSNDQTSKDHNSVNSSSANQNGHNCCKSREVKILLSKRELKELLGEMEDHGNIPVDQILDRLIDHSSDGNNCHHEYVQQLWKPDLESIPEEN